MFCLYHIELYLDKSLFYSLTLTEEQFYSLVCHGNYNNKDDLNQHMKVHDKSKAFKCDICFRVFKQKSNLERHYRTHTGEKPFACQVCDKKFARKFSLVQHQATHSEVRPFKCTICPEGRYFKTKHGLTNHMVYHYEPKFACSHCDHKTYTKCHLNVHEEIHKKKKKFVSN